MKEIIWNKEAKSYIRKLNLELRKEIGALFMLLQNGLILGSPQSKPFKSIHSLFTEGNLNYILYWKVTSKCQSVKVCTFQTVDMRSH